MKACSTKAAGFLFHKISLCEGINMKKICYLESYKMLYTPEIVSLLTRIHEYKGKQKFYLREHTKQLGKFSKIAAMQSIEASNKIEGICVTKQRLKKLVIENRMPETRDEESIVGYRDALHIIQETYPYTSIEPTMILQLHQKLYQYENTNMGGRYKTKDNSIVEIHADGSKQLRFQPISALETKEAMQQLCDAFLKAKNKGIEPLLLIPMFILDFLCVHPFQDGNGRISRLLTVLMLYQEEYMVNQYISIEKIIEKSKETYYEALQDASYGWHENKHSYIPFVTYYLGTIVAAYREFDSRTMMSNVVISKPERIERIMKEHLGQMTKLELIELCPDISQTTIQHTLAKLVKEHRILKKSKGRGTFYIYNHEE